MKSNWTDGIKYKPDINENDEWDKKDESSDRVAVWIEGDDCARYGRYNHRLKRWSVEGYLGFAQSSVKFWQYITNPYK